MKHTTLGTNDKRRFVWPDRLEWKDGKPDVLAPMTSPQPVP